MSPSRAQEEIESLSQRVGALDRYLIDLKGYLVVNNALPKQDVINLNQLIDAQLLPPPTTYNRFGTAPLGAGFLGWHAAFVALIDHPSVIDILQFLLGPTFSLRSIYGIYEERFVGNALSDELRSISNDEEETGLACCVVWNITDTGPGIGGLCCVEGSHHVRGELPASIKEAPQTSRYVVTPDAPAGSAIVCTSRLAKGNGSWRGPHQRRSLVLEYTSSTEEDPTRRIAIPPFELTRRQKSVLGYANS